MKINIPSSVTGKAVFEYLAKNKLDILDMKKSALKLADVTECLPSIDKKSAAKATAYLYENDEEKGVLKRTIVANTYNWMDSHDDVHLDGLFAKTIKERGKRIPHLHDHIFELTAKVGNPIQYYEGEIKWKQLGVNKDGSTMALFLETEILKSYNEQVYNEYLNNQVDQHSVSMQYIKLEMAFNNKDYKDEYKVWKAYIDRIGNPEVAERKGYFYAIHEAKLRETSAVLLGSNELTPTLGKTFEPLDSTRKDEPRKSTLNIESILNHYKL